LIFSRIVEINRINTLGGAAMVYDTSRKDILLKEYTQRIRKAHPASINMERYRMFYELNQKYGLEVMYKRT